MKILFLHGWTSVPGGRKPTFLKDDGHTVLNPALPGVVGGDWSQQISRSSAFNPPQLDGRPGCNQHRVR
jgi:hypothetical protein